VDDLRKALRGLRERMPHYDLPAIDRGGAGGGAAPVGEPVDVEAAGSVPEAQVALFPPGPLATVAIAPRVLEVAPGGERRAHARACDRDGRAIRRGLVFGWSIEGEGLSLEGAGPHPAIRAAGELLPGARGVLRVVVAEGSRTVTASAEVVVAEVHERERGGDGIPRPELVDAPGMSWRSRME